MLSDVGLAIDEEAHAGGQLEVRGRHLRLAYKLGARRGDAAGDAHVLAVDVRAAEQCRRRGRLLVENRSDLGIFEGGSSNRIL